MTYTLDRSAPRHQSERLHDNTTHKVPFLDHVIEQVAKWNDLL